MDRYDRKSSTAKIDIKLYFLEVKKGSSRRILAFIECFLGTKKKLGRASTVIYRGRLEPTALSCCADRTLQIEAEGIVALHIKSQR